MLAGLAISAGCHSILATGIYLWQGGNMVAAECEALADQRVVVVCRPPSSHEFHHAGASRSIAREVSNLLEQNVPGIEVVNPKEVDNWIDESDWGDCKELGKAVKADMVVHIELDHFDLYKGKTLYQGNADVTVSVYNMNDKGRLVWDKHLGEILYPQNSGIPAQDKPVQHFEREFVEIAANQIAMLFYKHDAYATFALDSLANR
jgi:hypothetical protein